MKKFYITTPIYYPSAKPHMGHAYSSIAADVIARFKKIQGYDVSFLTGTDEHGLKIQKAAQNLNKNPQIFCDEISKTFVDLAEKLNLSHTDFIRTTENRHKKTAQEIWNLLEKNDQIYLSKYAGWYSVSDEAYYSEDEIEDKDGQKLSIASGSKVEWMEEESYFFKLSEWGDKLLDHYENNLDFIKPESRRNEVVSFVKQGLKDLSISRTTFDWGIPVPNHSKHVMYVWLDALTNYVSATNFFNNHNGFWPSDVHIIGKDILRFHAIYWPAFLMAAKLPLPKQVFSHGWILSGEEKMSKSKGNILDPLELMNDFGVDEIRYYLMKEVIFGLDGKVNLENLKTCINDLANNIGNLSNRLFTLISKYYENKIPPVSKNYSINENLIVDKNKFEKLMDQYEIHNYVKEVHAYSSLVNKYVNDNAPWDRKSNSEENIGNILFSSLNSLKNIFVFLYPIMPSKSKLFLSNFNINEREIFLNLVNTQLQSGQRITKPEILFKKY